MLSQDEFTMHDRIQATILLMGKGSLLILQGATALLTVSAYFILMGLPITRYLLGHSWDFDYHHLLYAWCAGLTLGMPVTILLLVAAPFAAEKWIHYLHQARQQRLRRTI